jgi:hypothetical protein
MATLFWQYSLVTGFGEIQQNLILKEKNDIFFGLQRGVTLLGNIFKISLETYSQILIFC